MTIEYDESTALVVVDVQNDFAEPAGTLYVRGGDEVVPIVNREIRRAIAAGATVVFTQDWHPASTPHFAKDGGVWPVHCVGGTWGAEFAPGLEVVGPVVRKGVGGEDGYSGFTVRDARSGAETSTGLAGLLLGKGAVRAIVVGLATDYCVKETALDAVRAGFATSVLLEAVRAVDLQPGDGDRALAELYREGVAVVSP